MEGVLSTWQEVKEVIGGVRAGSIGSVERHARTR
jgi:hypothetical protein